MVRDFLKLILDISECLVCDPKGSMCSQHYTQMAMFANDYRPYLPAAIVLTGSVVCIILYVIFYGISTALLNWVF